MTLKPTAQPVRVIAEACHEANRVLQKAFGDPVSPRWEYADAHTQASVIDGVHAHLDATTTLTPEESHQNWCAFKRSEGWTWGPVKDAAKKQHPLLVHYDDLPQHQKLKDHLFKAIVEALS